MSLTPSREEKFSFSFLASEQNRKAAAKMTASVKSLSMLCEPDVLRRRLRHQFISHLSTVRFLGIHRDR
jgi:hypothetical protein